MNENLPLIPEKSGAVCTDVRPLLREVFREYDCLPPLAPRRVSRAPDQDGDSTSLPTLNEWVSVKYQKSYLDRIEKYDLDRKNVRERERELKQQYAKRIAREPLPNIYKLRPAIKKSNITSGIKEQGTIDRRDLIPTLIQNPNVEDTLWVQNILNRSSGELTPIPITVEGQKLNSPVNLKSPREVSLQSFSIGELRPRVPSPLPARALPPPAADHILCVPAQLDFVNFTVGNLHSQHLRLINVSKFEVRLSVRPPSSRLLNIELCGTRGLTVTSGAAAELKVNFRPCDVRVLRDELLVRVSSGKLINIPIRCYMQPPLLDILVPAASSSILCTPGSAEAGIARSADCMELGARLLGDVHCVPVLFHCEAEHAAFFLLTEDAWLDFSLDVVTSRGSLVAAPFAVRPAWWRGGGAVRGCVWCRAAGAGLQQAALRVVATTAVVRPLYLIADALYFSPEHITLEAQDKDYDICADDDPACEYYVHLGTAFPGRSLSATVQLVNHSPVVYSYYWSARPWGECSCWEQDEQETTTATGSEWRSNQSDSLCVGAKEAKEKELRHGPPEPSKPWSAAAGRVRVEPARGSLAPRSSCAAHVCAPDVGEHLGTRRAVLMLILKGIPKESLPDDYDSMIIRTDVIDSDPMPGVKVWSREICEIVCAQMEVWWDVAPVRFVLDPALLHLDYSRRVTDVEMTVRATQLFGCEGISCSWQVPGHVSPPAPLALTAAHSCAATLRYQLPELPNHFPETDVIILEAARAEWQATSAVTRCCATRHPALRPARRWLGVVPPGATMHAVLEVFNDTYQHICWWATPFRWYGENPPSEACGPESGEGGGVAREPCSLCQERACTCCIIKPSRGALHHRQGRKIEYTVHAPQHDGCVASLVRVQRTSADTARAAGGAGSEARAALVAYRVLAPRLVLRVLPCHGDKHTHCECCALDGGSAPSARGTATLRPRAALRLARRACYRLRLTNTTPLPTAVSWDPPLEDDVLKVTFRPNQFDVGSYAQVEIQVVLEAREPCGRRLFLRRARVQHAYKPLYLVVDAAISGLEIDCEVPLGGDEKTDTTVVMRRTQAEVYPWAADKVMPRTFDEIFAEEDRKRAERAENCLLCRCKYEMMYIPPPTRPRPPPQDEDDYPPVEILWEPPPLTRVCACAASPAPSLPELAEPCCLQFHRLPLRTVRTRTVVLRNKSVLSATWHAAVRARPRLHVRSLNEDQWADDVRDPGLAVELTPSAGVLGARARSDLSVAVYADCWGLYRDQLAIKIDNLEAIVLDLWVEAVGPPLQFALSHRENEAPALCWMSAAEPARALRVKNVSRAELTVHAYVLAEPEHPHHELPFRLYLRLFDVEPETCPCLDDPEGEEFERSSFGLEMDTGVELFLAPDYGRQTDEYYTVSPETSTMSPGEWAAWAVQLQPPPELAPPSAIMLRAVPLETAGEGWARLPPAPQLLRLRAAARAGRLRASCAELRARACALHLPADVLRIRKRFHVKNVGNGLLEVGVLTEEPWAVVLESEAVTCGAGCVRGARAAAPRTQGAPLRLMPRSSVEMCVEVSLVTADLQPPGPAPDAPLAPPPYPPYQITTTPLHFYDKDNILMTLPLILELEFPVLSMEPASIDFGFVTDGDTRKSYYSIAHSSRTVALELQTEWAGGEGFHLYPRSFTLQPGARERIYIQYTAKWCGAPAEGRCEVVARGGAWCRAAGGARAAPARGLSHRAAARDHTDDTRLRPPPGPAPLCL